MKKQFYLFALILTSVYSFSQVLISLDDDQKYIDSIVKITVNTKSDSVKCLNSFRLSKLFLMVQNQEKSKFYLEQGNKLSSKNPFLKDASNYYNTLKFLAKGDVDGFQKSLIQANELLKKYTIPEAFRLRAIIVQNRAIMLQRQSNEKEAMEILVNEGIDFGKKSNDNEVLGSLYKTIGIICMNNNERKKADFYLNQAQDLIESSTKKSPTLIESKVETYNINAENLIELKQFAKAKKPLDKSFAILSKHPNSNLNNNYFYTEGVYYSKQNQHLRALISFEKGIKSSKLCQDVISLDRLNFAKYEALFKLKRFEEAKNIMIKQVETTPFIVNKKNYSRELAKTYNKMGDMQNAYLFAEKYIVLNDSLNDSKFKNEIITLEAKFNKTENEKKISQLLAQKEKAELVSKNDKLKLLLLGLVAIILLISTLFLWKYYQNQKKLNVQKELNFKQELETIQSQQELAVSNALLEGEEVERKRLARDLHDGLGSMLSGLKLYLNKLSSDNSQNSPLMIENLNNQLNNSIKELRHIAQNMMPETLLKLGLEASLKDLCLKFNSDNLAVEFQYYSENNTISESKQIMIYRIVQELINNVVKHAKASEILVSCSQNDTVFLITVEDNGIGFDSQKANLFDGMGLKNIKNRVEFLKGKLEIDSQSQKGAVFNIELNIAS